MIRAVFFDLDDTLIRYDAAYETALAASYALLVARHPHIPLAALRSAIWGAYEKRFGYGTAGFADAGRASVRRLRETLTGDALSALGIASTPDFVDALIAAHEAVEAREITPFPDTVPVLDALAPHFTLGVVTNGPALMQRAKLDRAGLTNRFRVIVMDTEFGHPKPDARIFAHAAKTAGFAPDEMLFVGNSPEADVAGAVGAGWTSVWLNAERAPLPAGVPAPRYELRTLGELLDLAPVVAVLWAGTERNGTI